MTGPFFGGVIFLIAFAFGFLLVVRRPHTVDRLPTWLRGRGISDPLFPFRSWRWREPPPHWKSRLFSTVFWSISFGMVTSWIILKDDRTNVVLAVVSGLMTMHFLLYSARIIFRCWRE